MPAGRSRSAALSRPCCVQSATTWYGTARYTVFTATNQTSKVLGGLATARSSARALGWPLFVLFLAVPAAALSLFLLLVVLLLRRRVEQLRVLLVIGHERHELLRRGLHLHVEPA